VALAAVLALGCVHPSVEPTTLAAGQASATRLPAEFELLSWNTHKQRHRGFEAELLRFCEGVELVLLQEATEAEPVWSLLPSEHAWTLVVAFEVRRGEIATGVATGSVASPLREQALLSPVREPILHTPKSSLLSWVNVRDDSILVINLHGINFRRAPALAAQLRSFEDALDAHAGPVIVAGDFNTWSARRREVVEAFAARHCLVSPFAEQPGLRVLAAEILPSRSSDHDALRVTLGLP
jgi:endonuclease/exonuclease/phosphatase (EEP) superfamily protein YafD